VRQVDVVDLSPDVLAHSQHFELVNGRPLEDRRTKVYVNDARHHLLMVDEESYDLVTGEPPPPTHVGVVNLYTQEFFELVRSRLRPGGWVTYWLPLYAVGDSAARKMVRAFLDVFPEAVLVSGYREDLILVGRRQAPIEIHPDAVERRVATVPGLRSELRDIALDSAVEVVGMLAATAPTLERATRGVEPLRDDDPILEYAIRELQSDPWVPADLVSVANLDLWCPRCWSDALDGDEQRLLRGYLEVIAHYYRSQAFLSFRPESALGRGVELSENAARAVAQSFYLQDLLHQLPPLYRRALLLEHHGQPRRAIASLKELLRANPEYTRAQVDLAELQLRFGGHE
jgi:spermidine synthase